MNSIVYVFPKAEPEVKIPRNWEWGSKESETGKEVTPITPITIEVTTVGDGGLI